MTTWDTTVDLVIVGSGGGGMVAALAADDAGASALVLEKQERIGGSTCMSGGIAWVPNNPVMAADGVPDSYEDAMAHFEAVVGDVGPCSSFERRHAFLTAGPEMVSFLQDRGVRFVYCPGYSDYYSSAKGGHDNGRGIEPVPFDGHVLGEWLPKLQPGLAKSLGLAVMTNEARSLSHYNRSLRAFAVSARVVMRTYAARPAPPGPADQRRVAHRADAADRRRPRDPDLDRGAARGAGGRGRARRRRAHRPRRRARVACGPARACCWPPAASPTTARCGPSTAAISPTRPSGRSRTRATPATPSGPPWPSAPRTDLMDEAWWLPSPRTGRFGQSTLDQARQRPRTIYVDAAGKRFVNESNSYMEVGKEMYARDKTSKAVPCWLIFDDRYRKRYAHQRSSPGRFPRKLLKSGMLKQAWTLKDLAAMCGIDPAGLAETVERFNENAERGVDPDYGRGESAYNRALGDPNHKVHPCLGPIDEAPFYACQVVPG